MRESTFKLLLTADGLNKRIHLIGIGSHHCLCALTVDVLEGMRRKGAWQERELIAMEIASFTLR